MSCSCRSSSEVVPEVDVAGGRVVVDPPEGLLGPLTGAGRLMRIDIVTIFPEYFGPLDVSLLGKARERGLVDVRVHDLRDHTDDVHRTVDDTPFGGGPGMVMTPEPWYRALDRARRRSRARRPGRGSSCRRRPAGR